MAKTKTYPLRVLVTAARSSGHQTLKLLKQLGIKPVQEIKLQSRTYREYDQEALEAIVRWRSERDAASAAAANPPAPEPAPVPPLVPAAQSALELQTSREHGYLSHQLTSVIAALGRIETMLTEYVTRPAGAAPVDLGTLLNSTDDRPN